MDYQYNFKIDTEDTYYIRLFMNTSYREISTFKILKDGLNINEFNCETYYTASNTDEHLKQNVDIKNTFTLSPGEYELIIQSEHVFTIYETHIMKYDNNKVSTIPTYEPEIVDIPEVIRPYNKYLIIPNTEADIGGLFWCFFVASYGIQLAIEYDLIPIIDFYGGLYYSNSIYDPSNLPNSWWNYFFYDPVPINIAEKKRVLEYSRSHRSPIRFRYNNVLYGKLLPISEDNCYYYTRGLFHKLRRKYDKIKKEIFQSYFKPLPYLINLRDEFLRENNPHGKRLIGLHYRGTDKYPTGTTREDNYVYHPEYDKVESIVRSICSDGIKDEVIISMSDEEGILCMMKERCGSVYISTLRSKEETSGLVLEELKRIRYGKSIEKEVLNIYNSNKRSSVHFGMKECIVLEKGKGVVLEVMLLIECDESVLSRGNVSETIKNLSKGVLHDMCSM